MLRKYHLYSSPGAREVQQGGHLHTAALRDRRIKEARRGGGSGGRLLAVRHVKPTIIMKFVMNESVEAYIARGRVYFTPGYKVSTVFTSQFPGIPAFVFEEVETRSRQN